MLSSMRPAVFARWLWQPMQYWFGSELSRAAGLWAAKRGIEHKRHEKHKSTKDKFLNFLCFLCSILFCFPCHKFFDEGDRARFCFTGMSRKENAFRPVQRRPAFLVFHIEASAFGNKPFDDFVGAAVSGAHESRDAH